MGTGLSNRLEITQLPNTADIESGDLLVTSGLGGHFPSGYPVAKVIDVRRESGQPFATILAEPSAQLERSREILLVWTLPAIQSEVATEPLGDEAKKAGTP